LPLLYILMALSACGHVVIKDSEWCGAKPNAQGAACFHTMTTDQRELSEVELLGWLMDAQDPKVCTSSQTLADLKANIEVLCHDSRLCDYETKKKVQAFFKRMESQQGAVSP
jgi:hypothetical protein